MDADTRPAWERLGQLLQARRARLDIRYRHRNAFAAAVGLNLGLIRDIETATRDTFTPATLAAIEQAYRYAPGSITKVLDGGDPIELPTPKTPAPETPPQAEPAAPAVSDATLVGEYEQQIWAMTGLSERVRHQLTIALKAAVEAEQQPDLRPSARVAEFRNRRIAGPAQ